MAEFQKMSLTSTDLVADRVKQLKQLLPEVVTESGIDFDKLRLVLGDEVDDGTERYSFTWPGKADAIRLSQIPSTATLRPAPAESVNWEETENLYIEGDNLEVLKLLQRSYHGCIKLIYIDPPYNTGGQFVYPDTFGDTIAHYREITNSTMQSNSEADGKHHSRWCSNMYARLRLSRELLSDDGALFISIDDHEEDNLRKICNEVFGEACFVGNVSWQRTYSPRNDALGIPSEVEHVIVYSKMPGWTPKKLPRTDEMNAGYSAPDGDSHLWASGDAAAPGGADHQGMVFAIQHPFRGDLLYPPVGTHWRMGQADLLEVMNEWAPYELREIDDAKDRARVCGISPSDVRRGVKAVILAVPTETGSQLAKTRYDKGAWPILYFTSGGEGGIRRKRYLDESIGRTVTNLWPYTEVGHTDEGKKELKALFEGAIPFDTPKPSRLMKRILDIASDEHSIVLDFFSGSATMADAVMQKNAEDGGSRTFIMVQIPEPTSGSYPNICEAGKERIRRAGKRIIGENEEASRQLRLGEETQGTLDTGFRVLKLDESGIERPKPGELLLDIVKPDRSDEDIIFEMMLKWGMELTLNIERVEAAGYHCYSVDYGELICCLEPGLTIEALDVIASMDPRRVLMFDRNLTDSLKLNAVQAFRGVEERTGREVELRTV